MWSSVYLCDILISQHQAVAFFIPSELENRCNCKEEEEKIPQKPKLRHFSYSIKYIFFCVIRVPFHLYLKKKKPKSSAAIAQHAGGNERKQEILINK